MSGGTALSLGRLMANYSAADAVAMFLNLAGIVVVVRTLSVEQFGLADLLRTVQWFLATLLGLNVFDSASRFYFDATDREEQRRILGGGLTAQLLAGCAAGAVLLLLIYPLGRTFLPVVLDARAVWFVALSIPAANLLAVLTQTATIRGASGTYAALVVSQAVLSVTGIYAFVVWLDQGLNGYLLALLLAAGVTGVIGYLVLADHYRWGWLVGPFRRYMSFGAPFTVTMLIQYGFGLVARLLLVRLTNPEALGWYGLAERAQVPMNLTVSSAGRAWLPWLLAERPVVAQSVSNPVRQLNGLVLIVLGSTAIFLRELIVLVGGERYGPAYLAALLLLIAGWIYFIGDWIVSGSLALAKRTHFRIWIYVVSYGAAGVASVWTIARWGSTGAAVAALIASALILLGMLAVTAAIYPLRHGLLRLVPASGLTIGLAAWGSLYPVFWPKPIFLAGYLSSLWLLGLLPAPSVGAVFRRV